MRRPSGLPLPAGCPDGLPLPVVYWGSIPLDNMVYSDSIFAQMNGFYAKYPPENPLKVAFDVVEIRVKVGGTPFVNPGKRVSPELLELIERADKGTEIVVDAVIINGPDGMETIEGPFVRKKTSEKDTHYEFIGPQYSKGC